MMMSARLSRESVDESKANQPEHHKLRIQTWESMDEE